MHRDQRYHSNEQYMVADNDDTDSSGEDIVIDNSTDVVEISSSNAPEPTFMNLQKSSALMLLKMKEDKLTQVTLQGIIDDVTGLCQNCLSAIHSAVILVTTNAGLSPNDIERLNDIFDSNNEFGRPFFCLETQHQQFKFYRENFKFVVRKLFL